MPPDRTDAQDERETMAINLARIDESPTSPPGPDGKRSDPRAESEHRPAWTGRALRIRRGRVSLEDTVLFTDQLSLLLRTGNGLVPSIAALSTQLRSPGMREVLHKVHSDLQEGSSFSDSLARNPKAFSPLYVNLVRAGEATGDMQQSLEKLAEMLGIERGLRARVREATAYPTVILGLMGVVLIFTMAYVLPRFADLFAGVEDQLPVTTRGLIAVANLAHSRWWVFPPIIMAAAASIHWALKTVALRRLWDRAKPGIPLVGRICEEAYLYRLFSSFSLLLGSHVPLLEAVEIVRGLVQDVRYSTLFDGLSRNVEVGHGVTRAFQEADFLPDTVKLMVATGETSGALDTVMGTLAVRYREDLESDIRRLSTLLEPALLIVMGAFVGLIALSLIVPIFKMSRTIR
jgi:type IV pilus assembly protein PilC